MDKMRYEYFAASNSAGGFVNYFHDVFNSNSCSKIYVVKGGPGTGKSRFMRDVANEAEARGLTVRYYYCSSDSESLDGIIIDEMKVGLLDGTAPHVFEPTLAGVREQIINLGEFWDEKKLSERADEIERLSTQKSMAYKRAYALLGACGKLTEAKDILLSPCVNRPKLSGAVGRWLHRLPASAAPEKRIGLCRAVGMNGKSKLDTYENRGGVLFTVGDSYRAAYYFLNLIAAEAWERKMSLEISCDPLMPSRIDAVCLLDAGITFVAGDGGERKINVKRFIDESKLKPVKDGIKLLEKEEKELEALALSAFSEVREHHFALEKIYMSAMDFSLKESYTENFIKKLFKKC